MGCGTPLPVYPGSSMSTGRRVRQPMAPDESDESDESARTLIVFAETQ